MAEANKNLGDTMKKFATRADGRELTTKDCSRWVKDAGLFTKNCNSNNLDITFSKHMDKKKKTLDLSQLQKVIDDIAKPYAKDKSMDEAAAAKHIKDKLAATDPKAHGTTGTSKTGNVKGMTDASKYTGSHKERFDESGKGKGKGGREDLVDQSGYVGNYRGEGTYDQKKK